MLLINFLINFAQRNKQTPIRVNTKDMTKQSDSYRRIYRKLSIYAILGLTTLSFSSHADTLGDARTLMGHGDFQQALALIEDAIEADPKSQSLGGLSLAAGECELALGNPFEALQYFSVAKGRGIADAYLQSALLEMKTYDLKASESDIKKYRELIRKASKEEDSRASEILEAIPLAQDMLAGRVEKITIIDSISVPFDKFFEAYKLSAPSGKIINAPDTQKMGPLWQEITAEGASFESEDGTVRYLTATTDFGLTNLYESFKLLDGSWSEPVPLFDKDTDAAYPFMMSDGCTFYFASRTEEGLGGYDIFRSNRDNDTGEFQNPVNMGMPYNSPGNDYMLAIDEYTGAGWWATDRAGAVGDDGKPMVTIYVFVPKEMRVNYDADTPDLASLAALWTLHMPTDEDEPQIPGWKYTLTDSSDYSELIASIQEAGHNNQSEKKDFTLIGPDGTLYNTYESLPIAARQCMKQYKNCLEQLKKEEQHIALLRKDYKSLPSKSAAGAIEQLQKRIEDTRISVKKAKSDLFNILRNN